METIRATPIAWRDISGTIAAGATAQQLSDGKKERSGFWFQNNSSGDLWIREGGTAAAASQPAMKIAAGAMYESPITGCPKGVLSVYGATTGQAFSAREW